MAQRLPVPGSDDNTWGDVLNGFLGVSLNSDGTVKSGIITTNEISSTAGIVKAQLATAVQTSLSSADTALQSVPAATAWVLGGVMLTGDFGGTASAPTTPTAVHLTGAETVAGIKTFSSKVVAIGSIQISTTSVAGQVWTASDTAGNGGWQNAAGGGSGITRLVTQVTAAMTAGSVAQTDYVYWWTGSTSYTLTLPTAVSNTDRYTLKNASTISQPVATTSSQTIEGGTSITISAGNSVDLISNGSNWMVI